MCVHACHHVCALCSVWVCASTCVHHAECACESHHVCAPCVQVPHVCCGQCRGRLPRGHSRDSSWERPGGPLQAAPEPPTPQTGSGVLVPGRPHLRQAGGGDGAGSPQGAPCVSAQSRRGLIPGPPAPPRRGLRRRRSGRGRQAAGSGQPSPGCCRVLPASPRAGGAGPREEITERPFAYCENCTGERRRQRLQNNMLFSRACQVARKPSSRLSPRSRGPRRGRGGGPGCPTDAAWGLGGGSLVSQLLRPAHGASVSTQQSLLPLGPQDFQLLCRRQGEVQRGEATCLGSHSKHGHPDRSRAGSWLTAPMSSGVLLPPGRGDKGTRGEGPHHARSKRLSLADSLTARGPVSPSPPHHGFRFPQHKGIQAATGTPICSGAGAPLRSHTHRSPTLSLSGAEPGARVALPQPRDPQQWSSTPGLPSAPGTAIQMASLT